jgi:hypothetical protein
MGGRTVTEIDVHVPELGQFFDHLDPSPLANRDIDPRAERFIVDWAKDLPRDEPLHLAVHVERPPAETAPLSEAVHRQFGERAASARRRLRELLRRARISLEIGIAFLAVALALSKLVENWLDPGGMLEVVRQSLSIAGWVAMWRPMELLLYDWWPIRAEARLFDRLATMPVRLVTG